MLVHSQYGRARGDAQGQPQGKTVAALDTVGAAYERVLKQAARDRAALSAWLERP